jgi:uncharacterized membrane protein
MITKSDKLSSKVKHSLLPRDLKTCSSLRKLGIALAGIAFAGGLMSNVSAALFTSFDYPNSVLTAATDINSRSQISGWYIDTSGIFHGFVLHNGNYSSIDFPGAVHTSALGINANGDVVGAYNLKDVGLEKDVHGYVLRNGTFTSIDFPNAAQTRAIGINQAGDIVGLYAEQQSGKHHGFLLRGGTFTSIDFPGSPYTDVWKINDNADIAGRYQTSGDQKFHLFLLRGGTFFALADLPDAAQMAPTSLFSHHSGMNGAGDIVSGYCDSKPVQNGGFNQNMLDNLHGLLLSNAAYSTIDFPQARATLAFGINDESEIVGVYQDPGGRFHGYLRTP